MKIFIIFFKNLLFFLQIKLAFQNEINSRILSINSCLKYEKKNECIKCREGYELINKHCYRVNCAVFGFCKYCDDYDCLKCQKGYKLNYGICDKKVLSKKMIFVKIIIPLIIIFLIVYIYLYRRKKAREKIETGQVIKFRHPKSGFYRMNFNFDKYTTDRKSTRLNSSHAT